MSWADTKRPSPASQRRWRSIRTAPLLDNKGTALRALRRFKEAMDCYARAVEIDPTYASAWNNKGSVLGVLYRLEEAIVCFDKALEINPHFAAALDNKRKAVEITQSVPEIKDEDIPF